MNILNNNQPLISVITVVFNGEKYLEKSILSVINQDYNAIEYIIIDGASTDNTLNIIKQYADKVDYWLSEPDNGIYHAFNKGVQRATGDWICFLGSDDFFWQQDALSFLVSGLLDTHCRLVHGQIAILNDNDDILLISGESWDKAKAKLYSRMSLPHPALLHHKSWFSDYGLFDENFKIAGDYEMILRGKNESVLFIPIIVAGMRDGGISSNFKNINIILSETRRAQLKNGISLWQSQFMFIVIRVYIRLVLQLILGRKKTQLLFNKIRGYFNNE